MITTKILIDALSKLPPDTELFHSPSLVWRYLGGKLSIYFIDNGVAKSLLCFPIDNTKALYKGRYRKVVK